MDLFSFYKSAYNQIEAQISGEEVISLKGRNTQSYILYGQAATTVFFMLQ